MDLHSYWQAIQQKVCVKCIDGDGKGNCRIDPSITCALEQYLPLIVTAVSRVNSKKIGDYVAELRNIVCSQCHYQSVNGRCILRSEVDCGLDRYFPLVVEAIEEVNEHHPSQA